jgi:hypothetical protein
MAGLWRRIGYSRPYPFGIMKIPGYEVGKKADLEERRKKGKKPGCINATRSKHCDTIELLIAGIVSSWFVVCFSSGFSRIYR